MNEIWRDIPGFEGRYQASSLGNIKGPRKIMNGDSGEHGKKRYTLYQNGKHFRLMGHVLVAKAFPEICGEWFENCHVHHKDCNPSNNTPENIICLTKEEHNKVHREMGQKVGSKNPFYGKHHTKVQNLKNAKAHRKPVIQLSIDGVELCYWFSCTDCERETGMCKASINKVCLGKQNTAYGFRWRYAS